jgi:uncharacterized protein (TIGR02145 family)
MRTKLELLAATLGLASALTLSCSSDDGGGGGTASGVGETVKIGTQTWMKKNLDVEAAGSKCYDDDIANCAKYGRLYDWATAQTVCPTGWHLPSRAEWDALTTYIEGDKSCTDCDAKHLKSAAGWNDDGNGLDSYGFAALPGGFSFDGVFSSAGNGGGWWSASEYGVSGAYHWDMNYSDEGTSWGSGYSKLFVSVRCLKGSGGNNSLSSQNAQSSSSGGSSSSQSNYLSCEEMGNLLKDGFMGGNPDTYMDVLAARCQVEHASELQQCSSEACGKNIVMACMENDPDVKKLCGSNSLKVCGEHYDNTCK